MEEEVSPFNSYGMNTEIIYRTFGEKSEESIKIAKLELARLEKLLSRYIQGSDVCRINQAAGQDVVNVSYDTFEVLSAALRFSEMSQGLFDITIGPLIDLWDYKNAYNVPEGTGIQNALPLVNYHDLILNIQDKTAGLRKAQQSIDLGGIGKGYASDRCIEIFREFGIKSAFVNIGGNVSTLGDKPDGSLWSVGIRHPRQNGCLIGAVKVSNKSVVTSGDYERYFVDLEGKRWHHILNPATGYPAESGLISVTVVSESAMLADAMSTSIFVAGMDKGLAFLEHIPSFDVILVDNDQQVFITKGLQENFQCIEGIKITLL